MILGSLRMVAEKITQEDCQQYAYLLLFPIYKLCEGFAGKVVSGKLSSVTQPPNIPSVFRTLLISCLMFH